MMGSTRSGLTDEEQEISDRLAEAFAGYINNAGFTDADGNVLTLEASEDGIYQAGSYYEYMKSVIEDSLNNFLSDTEFPYEASSGGHGMGRGGMNGFKDHGKKEGSFGGHGMPSKNAEMPSGGDAEMPSGDGEGAPFGEGSFPFEEGEGPDSADGEFPSGEGNGLSSFGGSNDGTQSYEEIDDIVRNSTSSGISISGTYETAQDYIDALNADTEWVSYDADSNTATITDIASFVSAFKSASKNLGAFDQLDGGQGENTLFGYGDGDGAHFDSVLAEILDDMGSSYAEDYAADLEKTDAAGNTVDIRLAMYTPLYYLLESEEGYGTSNVAEYWRIRTGIAQGDCALATEMDLALALEQYEGVESVDFETVWGAGHTQAERSGNSTDNFIAWVNECMAAESAE